MLKLITLVLVCLSVTSCKADASPPNADLMAVYPEARTELVALVSCRAYYVGQHYKDPLPSDEISKKSAQACDAQLKEFLAKIGKADGDPIFLGQLDRLTIAKINQVREGGPPPSGVGPKWANCIKSHLDISGLQHERLQSSLHVAFVAAFAECRNDESALSSMLSDKVGPSKAAQSVADMKKAIEDNFYENLLQSLKSPARR